jgi:hypothetical protein
MFVRVQTEDGAQQQWTQCPLSPRTAAQASPAAQSGHMQPKQQEPHSSKQAKSSVDHRPVRDAGETRSIANRQSGGRTESRSATKENGCK